MGVLLLLTAPASFFFYCSCFPFYGLIGFFGGIAFGISLVSIVPSSSFAEPPFKSGGNFVTGILTVAIGSTRRRIAPPRPATHTFVPPR